MKLELNKLELKNFLSYGNKLQSIDFQAGINLITGKDISTSKQNASGKSSILSAVIFALYGKADKDINIPQLVNWQNKKNCFVKIYFTKGKDKYEIERGLYPNILIVYKNKKELPQDANKRNFQEYIEQEILCLDYNTAISIIHCNPNNSVSLFNAPRGKKRKLIENLFNLSMYSNISDTCTNKIKNIEQKIYEHNKNISTNNDKIDILSSQIKDFKNKISTIKNKIHDVSKLNLDLFKIKNDIITYNVELYKTELNNNDDAIKRFKVEINEYNTKLIEYKTQLNGIKLNSNLKKLNKEDIINDLLLNKTEYDSSYYNNIINEYKISKNNIEFKIKELNKNIKALSDESQCPLCKQPLSKQITLNNENELKLLNDELIKFDNELKYNKKCYKSSIEYERLTKLKNEYELYENEKNLVNKLKNDIIIIEKHIKSYNENIKDHKDSIEHCNIKLSEYDALYSKKEKLESEIENTIKFNVQYEEQINDLNDYIEKNREQINILLEQIEEYTKLKMNLQTIFDYLDYIKNVCKDEGIKQYAISNIVPYLNQRVNKYISEAGFNFYLKLDNWLNVEIKGPGIHNSTYGNLSGGESKSVDLAMQLALLDVAKLHSGVFPTFLMLDEILDSAVDSQTIEKLMSIIKKKQKDDNSTIFIVSHRKELNELAADKIYQVIKEKGFSTIHEV